MFTDPDASRNDDVLSSLTQPYAATDAPIEDAAADADGNLFECEEVLIPDHRANVGPRSRWKTSSARCSAARFCRSATSECSPCWGTALIVESGPISSPDNRF